MSPTRDRDTPTRAEQDVIDVLVWLKHNTGRELSYADIARGTGLPDGARLRRAVRRARTASHVLKHRLEQFLPSRDPLRRGARVTRFHMNGQGDEFGARDALMACRRAVAYVGDMHRACSFEARNPNSLDSVVFGQMADMADGMVKAVGGMSSLGTTVVQGQLRERQKDQRIAELEARVTELTTEHEAASA